MGTLASMAFSTVPAAGAAKLIELVAICPEARLTAGKVTIPFELLYTPPLVANTPLNPIGSCTLCTTPMAGDEPAMLPVVTLYVSKLPDTGLAVGPVMVVTRLVVGVTFTTVLAALLAMLISPADGATSAVTVKGPFAGAVKLMDQLDVLPAAKPLIVPKVNTPVVVVETGIAAVTVPPPFCEKVILPVRPIGSCTDCATFAVVPGWLLLTVVPVMVSGVPATTVAGALIVVLKSSCVCTRMTTLATFEVRPLISCTVYGITAVPVKPVAGMNVRTPVLLTKAVPPLTVMGEPGVPEPEATPALLYRLTVAGLRELPGVGVSLVRMPAVAEPRAPSRTNVTPGAVVARSLFVVGDMPTGIV